MIVKIQKPGRSFTRVVAYCLKHQRPGEHDSRADRDPDQPGRVEWTLTHNMRTDDPRRAAREMTAVANYGSELKRVAGIAGGRRLEKPVCHYTLIWAEGETPAPHAQVQAALSSLEALGLSDRQALIVAHNDARTPHLHVIANRVSPEDGRAAPLSRSRLKLSRWAQNYEQEHGQIHCRRRVDHNRRRDRGEAVYDL